MTFKVHYSRASNRDLDLIGQHSEKIWGRVQARKYLSEIHQTAKSLSEYPERGSPSEVVQGLRKIHSGSHLIFYRMTGDVILVIRILHDRMDVDARLGD